MHGKKRATLKTKSADKQPGKGGRPTIYDPKIHPQAAEALCAKGLTIAELVLAFDVAISTNWMWKLSQPAFFESCRMGSEAGTARVEHSMYERAVGYTHDSVRIFMPGPRAP